MASGGFSLSEEFEEFLQCAVCLETFIDPRLLSCGHSFCLGCLQKIHKSGDIECICPTCRNGQYVSLLVGVSSLPKDHKTNGLIDIVNTHVRRTKMDTIQKRQEEMQSCSICKAMGRSVAAKIYCVTCKHTLCLTCTDDHNKSSRMKNHTVAKIEETKLPYLLCGQHPTEFVHDFCDDCKKSICEICTLKTHKKHKIIDLDSSARISNGAGLSFSRLGSSALDDNEIVIIHAINNVGFLRTKTKSEQSWLSNLPWNVKVVPSKQNDQVRWLGVYIECNTEDASSEWSCAASVKMQLLGRRPAKTPLSKTFYHTFCSKENEFGYEDFARWDVMLNPNRGFIRKGSVTLEVSIHAVGAKKVLKLPERNFPRNNARDIKVKVFRDCNLHGYKRCGIFDPKTTFREFKVWKTTKLGKFLSILSYKLSVPESSIRPWPFVQRPNKAFRPTVLDTESDIDQSVEQLSRGNSPWILFVEVADKLADADKLPSFHKHGDVFLFLKKYEPETDTLCYCGHVRMPIAATLREFLLPVLCKKGGFIECTPLLLYEEVTHKEVISITEFDEPFGNVSRDMMDGDIIIFQKDEPLLKPKNPVEYFKNLR